MGLMIDVLPNESYLANCYAVLSDKAAILIDPGAYSESAEKFLRDNAQRERLILLTHAHFDHIGGAEQLRKKTGVKIAIGRLDAPALSDGSINLSANFGIALNDFNADILLEDNQIFDIGDIKIKAIHTPGHTEGGMCYLLGDNLFSGDTLFCRTYGRTDFPTGDEIKLIESIKRLFSELDDNVMVYPGHNRTTTIGSEKKKNFLVLRHKI